MGRFISNDLDCMRLESLKLVTKISIYRIRIIKWEVCSYAIIPSLSPTYSTYRRKSQAQVWRNIQTSDWVVDWFDVLLHGAFQIFRKQDLMVLLYHRVVALSPCQRITIVHTGNANSLGFHALTWFYMTQFSSSSYSRSLHQKKSQALWIRNITVEQSIAVILTSWCLSLCFQKHVLMRLQSMPLP